MGFHQPSIIFPSNMDLPYPSQKDDQLNAHLVSNRMPSVVLKDSLRNIPQLPPLPPYLKKQLHSIIRYDYAYELRDLMDKEVVSMRVEVGRDGSEENLLHLCCREDAVGCLQFLLRTYYQYFPAEFEWWVNLGSRDKMTGAMLCGLTASNECLKLLLEVGGVDIHMIDVNKLSAYQIALNSKNEAAVEMLLQYESKPKRSQLLNRDYLSRVSELVPANVSYCQKFYRCLFDCFTGGNQPNTKKKTNARRASFLQTVEAEIGEYFMDKAVLGLPREVIAEEEIEWKLMGEYQQKGSIGVLFDTFSPFDMEDILHPNENFLIALQSLSQHPWLVRRVVQADRAKAGQYSITLHSQHAPRTISTDSFLPFIANTGQPVFLADKKEGWPMILQKAFAKHFGSYSSIEQLSPRQLLETLTGWPVVRWEINEGFEAMQMMQRMNYEGYMYILEGKPNSLLSCPAKPNCCFTVLTFYTKGKKRMVLVNCPFVDPNWVEKEKHEILALKILRGHYNCRQQMTIWVEEDRLKEYFSSLLIAPIKPGFNRYSLSCTVSQWLYFRVHLSQSHEEPPLLYIVDQKSNAVVSLSSIQGWVGEKERVQILAPELSREEMASFEGKAGEYLFRAKVPKGKYLIVGWASDELKIEPVEETFGEIEWIGCLRKYLALSWAEEDQIKIACPGEYTLVMARRENGWVSQPGNSEVIEGNRKEGQGIEMVGFDDYCYCVLRGDVQNVTLKGL